MEKRSIIVALCGDAIWTKEPYEKTKYSKTILKETYAHLFLEAEKKHVKIVKTSYEWYNKKTNTFEKGWICDKALGWVRIDDFKADMIFDKVSDSKKIRDYRRLFSRKHMLFNPYYIQEACTDKYKTYKLFKTLSPRTFKVRNKTELKKNLKRIRTEKVVYKPSKGSSARGIVVCDIKDLLKKVRKIKEEHVLQEFIECKRSSRIRMHYGVYDIRIVLSQGKIIDSYIRASRKKEILMSNTALGGKMIFIHKDQIPKDIIDDLDLIERKFKHYKSRLYTADFVVDKNGRVWLIELNDKPGIFLQKSSYAWKKRRDRIANAIIKNFKAFKRKYNI